MSKERELLKRWFSEFGKIHADIKLLRDTQTLLAQHEQEPEAWILEDKKTGYRRQSAYKPTDLDEEACNVIPLYTAPPKRESLTPRQGLEEYKKGYARAEIDLKREPLSETAVCEILIKKEWRGFVDLVRIIEKAHGIGGGNE